MHSVLIVLNVKGLVGAFNQEKDLVGASSVITNLPMCGPSFQPLLLNIGRRLCQYEISEVIFILYKILSMQTNTQQFIIKMLENVIN